MENVVGKVRIGKWRYRSGRGKNGDTKSESGDRKVEDRIQRHENADPNAVGRKWMPQWVKTGSGTIDSGRQKMEGRKWNLQKWKTERDR